MCTGAETRQCVRIYIYVYIFVHLLASVYTRVAWNVRSLLTSAKCCFAAWASGTASVDPSMVVLVPCN